MPIQRLNQARMKERCDRGLCYNCDDKWSPGQHRCKVHKLYLLYGVESDDAVAVEDLQDAVEESSIDDEPEISLCEIPGAPTPPNCVTAM